MVTRPNTELSTLSLVGGAQGFNWLPVFVAEECGLFERHGLSVTFQRTGSLEAATNAVRDGGADLGIGPPEGAIADHVAGGPLRIIATEAERLPMALVTKPEITSVGELRGKKIGTSSLREGTAIYTQVVLAAHGLLYPRDYEFVLAGVHDDRWRALQKGEIDCAPQPAPWSFLAEEKGYNLIAHVHAAIPKIMFAGVFGRDEWLRNNRGIVTSFLGALSEAVDLVNDPRNSEICLPIFRRITLGEPGEAVTKGFVYMRDIGMWPAGLKINQEALNTTVDLMVQLGLIEKSDRTAALGSVDYSFLAQAEPSLAT